MDESKVKEYLAENDEEFRKLVEKHREFDRQLQSLVHKTYPNGQEQLQETILKKKKLAVKDQMQMRLHQYMAQQQAS